jgi:hypothetical protein
VTASVRVSDLELVIPHRRLLGEVCDLCGEDPFILSAIGMRESRFGWAAPYWPKGAPDGWGDGATKENPKLGHGYGYFQIDRRWHRAFLNRVDRADPHQQAIYACGILRDNRAWFRRNPAIRTDDPDQLQRMTVSAYNCGCGNVHLSVVEGKDPDARTTGRDYSAWVLSFAADLRQLAPELFALDTRPLPPRAVPDPEIV